MTPEQLDEIEKLAEAATPGPWDADVGVDFDDGCPIIEWYACGPSQESREFDEDGLPSLGAAKGLAAKDAAFIVAMRDHALPLVKALREARVERDEARDDARLADCQLDEIVELVGGGGDGSAFGSVESLLCDLKELTEERDEARAEVDRLRAALGVKP